MIRHQGEFIAPVLVEEAALTCAGVIEAAAYGIPAGNSEPGEQEVALAVIFPAGDPERVSAHLRDRLPAVAVPALVHVLTDLPRSPGTGKVQKQLLRARAAGRSG